MRPLGLILLLTLATPASGQPTLTMPPTVAVTTGRLTQIVVKWTGKTFGYDFYSTDAGVIREQDDTPGEVSLQVIAYKPGSFYVAAFATSADGQLVKAKCLVTAADPTPPGPVPGPPAKKSASLPYRDAYDAAMAMKVPLVVWVNCTMPETLLYPTYIPTTATMAWNDPTPRIVVGTFSSGSLYWAADLPPGTTGRTLQEEIARLAQSRQQTFRSGQLPNVQPASAAPMMTRSC